MVIEPLWPAAHAAELPQMTVKLSMNRASAADDAPADIGTEFGTFTNCARAAADRSSTPMKAEPLEEELVEPVAEPNCDVLLVSDALEAALLVPGRPPE
jgi:hypothetical protein